MLRRSSDKKGIEKNPLNQGDKAQKDLQYSRQIPRYIG